MWIRILNYLLNPLFNYFTSLSNEVVTQTSRDQLGEVSSNAINYFIIKIDHNNPPEILHYRVAL